MADRPSERRAPRSTFQRAITGEWSSRAIRGSQVGRLEAVSAARSAPWSTSPTASGRVGTCVGRRPSDPRCAHARPEARARTSTAPPVGSTGSRPFLQILDLDDPALLGAVDSISRAPPRPGRPPRFGRLRQLELAERLLELATNAVRAGASLGGDRRADVLDREPDRAGFQGCQLRWLRNTSPYSSLSTCTVPASSNASRTPCSSHRRS